MIGSIRWGMRVRVGGQGKNKIVVDCCEIILDREAGLGKNEDVRWN